MTSEEPADGLGEFFQQERRVLDVGADGSYRAQNWVQLHEGTWRLEGEDLVVGETRMRLEKVDAHTLVLIEDMPEIYRRDGPPRKVRNTYRRVDESELGPMLGERVETSVPDAGDYTASYAYAQNKLPTMEISIDHYVEGRGRLQLAADGTLRGCFGVATLRRFAESKYSSRDGEHHSDKDEDHALIGMRGTWTAKSTHAHVTAAHSWLGACAPGPDPVSMGPIELECQALARNETLPVPVLACRIVHGPSMLHALAVNPADSERAGPYTLQTEPRGHLSPDQGRPWLLLGAGPGLRVTSEDGSRDRTPVVTFAAGARELVQTDWVATKDAAE